MDSQPPRLTFGQYVRHLRESRGWNQEQLQDKADLSAGTISRLENDATNPTKTTYIQLAQAFGMSEGALLSGYEAFVAGKPAEAEPQPAAPQLRRITDRGLDPVAVTMAQRIQKLTKQQRLAIESVLVAFEVTEQDSDTNKS